MHSAVSQLALVLAAEKSKVPFYVAGGVLVLWALFISLAVGMRRPDFPANLGQQRAVMAVTVVLVLAAVSMAVVTSGGEKKAVAATPAEQTSTAVTPAEQTTTATTAPAGASTAPSTAAPAPAGAKTSLKLAADPSGQLSYDAKQLSAKAGAVTITMTNMSPLEHNVTIAQGATVLGSTPTFKGGSKSVTLNLKPGTYTFYCSVPGHRAAGMEGTLTVS